MILTFRITAINILVLLTVDMLFGNPGNLPPYKIRENDLISVVIYGHEDLTIKQRIRRDGNISIPLIGSVNVLDLTIREAEEIISKNYVDQKFLKDPKVIVSVSENGIREVYIMGEVKKAGSVALKSNEDTLAITAAIASAGGFTDIAKRNEVKVIRGHGNEETLLVVNVDDFINPNIRSGSRPKQFVLFPGDVVFVPRRIF